MTTESEARDIFSASYQQTLAHDWHETYNLYASGGQTINCSSFTRQALKNAFGQFGCNANGALSGCSEDQLKAIGNGTGHCMAGNASVFEQGGAKQGQIKAGMVLALRSGLNHKWAAGRELGVDHIACVYEDFKTHELMVAESTSSKSQEKGTNGVQRTKLNDWLDHHSKARETLYVVDPVELATGQTYVNTGPAPRTALSPATSTTSGQSARGDFNDNALPLAVFGMLMQLVSDAVKGEQPAPQQVAAFEPQRSALKMQPAPALPQ